MASKSQMEAQITCQEQTIKRQWHIIAKLRRKLEGFQAAMLELDRLRKRVAYLESPEYRAELLFKD